MTENDIAHANANTTAGHVVWLARIEDGDTGEDDLAEAWVAIQRIDMKNLGEYPDIVAALPNAAPFTELSDL